LAKVAGSAIRDAGLKRFGDSQANLDAIAINLAQEYRE
jgi:hypothetical protein